MVLATKKENLTSPSHGFVVQLSSTRRLLLLKNCLSRRHMSFSNSESFGCVDFQKKCAFWSCPAAKIKVQFCNIAHSEHSIARARNLQHACKTGTATVQGVAGQLQLVDHRCSGRRFARACIATHVDRESTGQSGRDSIVFFFQEPPRVLHHEHHLIIQNTPCLFFLFFHQASTMMLSFRPVNDFERFDRKSTPTNQ